MRLNLAQKASQVRTTCSNMMDPEGHFLTGEYLTLRPVVPSSGHMWHSLIQDQSVCKDSAAAVLSALVGGVLADGACRIIINTHLDWLLSALKDKQEEKQESHVSPAPPHLVSSISQLCAAFKCSSLVETREKRGDKNSRPLSWFFHISFVVSAPEEPEAEHFSPEQRKLLHRQYVSVTPLRKVKVLCLFDPTVHPVLLQKVCLVTDKLPQF